jgi:signal peptidase I
MGMSLPAEQLDVSKAEASWEQRVLGWVWEVLETLIPALLIVLVVNTFLAQATRVEGPSMEPTLQNNQRLIVEKLSFRVRAPQRGDIVVFRLPSDEPPSVVDQVRTLLRTALSGDRVSDGHDPLIKRIIGLPGELIEVRDGHVYVNGDMLEEPYLTQLTHRGTGPQTIAEDHVFVLGDNRGASNDSRVFGQVPITRIIGRAWVRYWPLSEMGPLR